MKIHVSTFQFSVVEMNLFMWRKYHVTCQNCFTAILGKLVKMKSVKITFDMPKCHHCKPGWINVKRAFSFYSPHFPLYVKLPFFHWATRRIIYLTLCFQMSAVQEHWLYVYFWTYSIDQKMNEFRRIALSFTLRFQSFLLYETWVHAPEDIWQWT